MNHTLLGSMEGKSNYDHSVGRSRAELPLLFTASLSVFDADLGRYWHRALPV